MVRLSKEEMLHEWKRRKGMLPVSTSKLTVNRSDSDNVDDMLKAEIDDWYSHLLATERIELLPTRDMAAEVTLMDNGDGSVGMKLPDSCVRLVSVRLRGWRRSARIVDDADSALARMQASRYVSGKICDPVAVKRGRHLTLYSRTDQSPALSELICVAPPPDGSYVFDRSALTSVDNCGEKMIPEY